VYQAIEIHAKSASYHPLRDHLSALRWDGIARLDTWLTAYLGVPETEYSRKVGAMWMISAVARAFQPGCKVDYMLVLEGAQSAQKSTACKVLGREWFSDTLPQDNLGSKDTSQHLRGKWIVELAEMRALFKNGSSTLKDFITRQVESYRPSYGRADVYEPRQCVLIGTINKRQYFSDETGNRRYWPVRTGEILINELERDRDQIWAEAVRRYRSGEPWYPNRDFEAQYIKPEQDARFEQDAWEECVSAWSQTAGRSEGGPVKRATIMEIANEALKLDMPKLGRAEQNRIRKIITRLGWHQNGPRGNNGERYWYPPDD
jgi:predicted P-loop ATPase